MNASADHQTELTSQFWVASSPFFESALVCVPCVPGKSPAPVRFRLFDVDGALINEGSISFGAGAPGSLMLKTLLESAKLESGLQHGRLVVEHGADVVVYCRMHTRDAAGLLNPVLPLSQTHSVFFPVTFSDERSYLVCVTNESEVEAPVRCRMFLGNRSPEVVKSIPPFGARVVSLTAEFSEFLTYEPGRTAQGYVRLTTRDGAQLGAQLVERTEVVKDHYLYTSVG